MAWPSSADIDATKLDNDNDSIKDSRAELYKMAGYVNDIIDEGPGGGRGTVNTGSSGHISYYPSTGTTIDDTGLKYFTASGVEGIQAEGTDDTRMVSSSGIGYVSVSYGGDIVLLTSTGSTISAVAANLNVGNSVSGSTANIRPGASGATRILKLIGRSSSADGAILSLDGAAEITTVSNGNITLAPNGTGQVIFNAGITKHVGTTTADRDALTPENGMIIYNSTTNKFQGYANSVWVDLH